MQCQDVAQILEHEGLGGLPGAAQAHLEECRTCHDFVADLNALITVAHQLPAEVDPPVRMWISLRTQLEQEGIIRDAIVVRKTVWPSWWHGTAELFRGRVYAAAALAVLIFGVLALEVRKPNVSPTAPPTTYFADTASVLNQQERDLSGMQLANSSTIDTSLRQNLQTLNDFIHDCERRLEEEPRDELAREYLAGAYQQKAELLSAMMDRGRSLN